MKRMLAFAFIAATAFAASNSAAAAGRAGNLERHDNRYEERYGDRDHRWNDNRWHNGRLGGSWNRSCTDSYVRRGVLYADCRTRNGKWRQTALRVDNCRSAENSNGRLVCTQWRRR